MVNIIKQNQTDIDTASQINGEYTPSNYTPTDSQVNGHLEGIDNALVGLADKYLVTVGATGADFTNINDAIDDVRLRNGGIIKIIDDLHYFSSGGVAKDVSNITFMGKSATVAGGSAILWNSGAGAWIGDNVSFVGITFRARPGSSGSLITASGSGKYYFRDCTLIVDGSTSPSLATSLFDFNGEECHAYMYNCDCWCPSTPGNRKIFINDNVSKYWLVGKSRLNADTPSEVYRDSGSEVCGTTVITTDTLIDDADKVNFDNTITGKLSATNVQDAIDELSNSEISNEQQILYVGKHGNDTNSGENIEQAFLTFNAAIAKAVADTPGVSNRYAIVCLDAGIYTDNIILQDYIDLYAPNAIFDPGSGDSIVFGDNSNIVVNEVYGNNIAIYKNIGSGASTVKANKIICTSTGNGIQHDNSSTDSELIAEVNIIEIEDGTAIGSNITAQNNIKFRVNRIDMKGGSSIAIAQNAAGALTRLMGYVDEIINNGAPAGPAGIDLQDGFMDVTVKRLDAPTAYNVGLNGELNLTVYYLSGSKTNNNVVRLVQLNGGSTDQVIKTLDATGNVDWDDLEGTFNITTVNSGMSPYTPTTSDKLLLVDTSGGAVTIDFADATTVDKNTWIVKKTSADANQVTIQAFGGAQNIDGAVNFFIGVQYNTYHFLADATAGQYWQIT